MYERMMRDLSTVSPGRVIIEYLFIEYAEKQVQPINDDQGYQYGFINMPESDFTVKDSPVEFTEFLLDELNYSSRTYERFKRKSVRLADYRFAIVDASGKITEYSAIDADMMSDLRKAGRGLIIVGKNLDLYAVQETEVFCTWFRTYVKGVTSREAPRDDYI